MEAWVGTLIEGLAGNGEEYAKDIEQADRVSDGK